MSCSDIPSSFPSSVVTSMTEGLGVAPQDGGAARPEGAGSGGDDAGLVLLEASLEEGVTLVPERAALPLGGLEVTALPTLQHTMGVLEVTDLELKHPHCTHNLERDRRVRMRYNSYTHTHPKRG